MTEKAQNNYFQVKASRIWETLQLLKNGNTENLKQNSAAVSISFTTVSVSFAFCGVALMWPGKVKIIILK